MSAMKQNSSFKILAFLALALIGIAGFWFSQNRTPEPIPDTIIQTPEPSITAETDLQEEEFELSLEPSDMEKEIARQESILSSLPSSLKDVPPPDDLDVDENGNLVINDKIRHLFDHHLTAIGEEDIERILERIRLILDRQLEEPAHGEALKILQGYVDYRGSIDQIMQSAGSHTSMNFDPKNITSLKQQVRVSRSNFFSDDVIKAFFEKEDQYDDYMLAKATIANDEVLSKEEKLEAIKALQKNTPAWLTQQESKANSIGNFRQKEQVLRDSGAEDWEIKDFRRRELGDQAAANLEKLDQQREDWNNRLSAYRDEVKDVMVQYDDPNSPEALAKRNQIREDHFKDNELRRVKSLDDIASKD